MHSIAATNNEINEIDELICLFHIDQLSVYATTLRLEPRSTVRQELMGGSLELLVVSQTPVYFSQDASGTRRISSLSTLDSFHAT